MVWKKTRRERAIQYLPSKTMLEKSVAAAEVFDWIMTIRKAEEAYPNWTPVELTNAMRRLAGYDYAAWLKMYGDIKPAQDLAPYGPLTLNDIDNLKKWTKHSSASTGLITDADGNRLASGHVLTGISAGVYRDRDIDVTPAYALWIGEKMDNLYASTISGDLGQAAVFVNERKQTMPYIGSHGEADDAELIGDIDGFILGAKEPKGGSGRKLSDILNDYYCSCKPTAAFRRRMSSFVQLDSGRLKDQVQRFATTYVYKSEGEVDGFFSEVRSEANSAFEEFQIWLIKRQAEEREKSDKIEEELNRLKK